MQNFSTAVGVFVTLFATAAVHQSALVQCHGPQNGTSFQKYWQCIAGSGKVYLWSTLLHCYASERKSVRRYHSLSATNDLNEKQKRSPRWRVTVVVRRNVIFTQERTGLGTETHFLTINVSHPTPTLLNANTCHHQRKRKRIQERRIRNNRQFDWNSFHSFPAMG